jgi:hypothetical protein
MIFRYSSCFLIILEIENAYDSDNTISVSIFAAVRSVLEEEVLVIGSGNLIDFGDCCANQWRTHRLALRNASDSPLDISFTTDTHCLEFQLNMYDMSKEERNFPTIENFIEEDGGVKERREERSRDSSADSVESERSASPPNPIEREGSTSPTPSLMKKQRSMSVSSSVGNEDSRADLLDDLVGDGTDFGPKSPTQSLGHDIARIEELLLRPGQERTVEVCFRPDPEYLGVDGKAARFARQTFRLFLTYSNSIVHKKEKKTIQCKARVCTSFISCSPLELDFGYEGLSDYLGMQMLES